MLYCTKKEYCNETIKNKVSITLDIDLVEQLKGLAEADDRSFSQYVNLCLKECLASKVNKKTRYPEGAGHNSANL